MYQTGTRTVSLWGTSITDETTYDIKSAIEDIFAKDGRDDWITLEINSGGGDFTHGMALYDWLTINVPCLQTIGYGEVNSMAIILFLAGHHRAVSQNTRFLLHPVSDITTTAVTMNPKAHMESAKNLLVIQKMYTDVMMDRLLISPERKKLQAMIDAITILTPKKAKKLGLIHEIL